MESFDDHMVWSDDHDVSHTVGDHPLFWCPVVTPCFSQVQSLSAFGVPASASKLQKGNVSPNAFALIAGARAVGLASSGSETPRENGVGQTSQPGCPAVIPQEKGEEAKRTHVGGCVQNGQHLLLSGWVSCQRVRWEIVFLTRPQTVGWCVF